MLKAGVSTASRCFNLHKFFFLRRNVPHLHSTIQGESRALRRPLLQEGTNTPLLRQTPRPSANEPNKRAVEAAAPRRPVRREVRPFARHGRVAVAGLVVVPVELRADDDARVRRVLRVAPARLRRALGRAPRKETPPELAERTVRPATYVSPRAQSATTAFAYDALVFPAESHKDAGPPPSSPATGGTPRGAATRRSRRRRSAARRRRARRAPPRRPGPAGARRSRSRAGRAAPRAPPRWRRCRSSPRARRRRPARRRRRR